MYDLSPSAVKSSICTQVREKFGSAGGVVMEQTPAEGVSIHPNGVALQLQQPDQSVTGQLLIDCMGNFSPIVRQVRNPVGLTSACLDLQLPHQLCLAAFVRWQWRPCVQSKRKGFDTGTSLGLDLGLVYSTVWVYVWVEV